jgi:WD40 repeat protein
MDRDFLFGVMAVQLSFASPQQVMAAAGAFLGDKSKSIAERLVADGVISAERRAMLDALVAEAVKLHGGDAKRTLHTLGGERALYASFGGSVVLDPAGAPTMAGDGAPVAGGEDAARVTLENPGRYALKGGRAEAAEIGRGGIGRVLIAHDEHLGRDVAVKELLGDGASGGGATPVSQTAAMAARFLREARVTGQLEHPNIVPVYELGRRADGTLYYTMKLVRGRSMLAAIKDAGGLAGRLKLLPHFVDLCQAVAYAHSRGVVHRDLKPENAMLGEFGETVLLDWGLAKVRGKADIRGGELAREIRELKGADAGRTVDGSALGTPAYMSPEQADGKVEEIDERSDVWSLGAVLYEVLTGRPPFEGFTPFEVMGKVLKDAVTPPRELDAAIPAELAAVALKALTRDKPGRYQSAKQMAEEVEAYLTGARVGAYEYGSLELLKRAVKKNKALSLAVLAVFLVTVAGLLLVWRMYGRAETARVEADENKTLAEKRGLESQKKEEQATSNLAKAWAEKGRKYEDTQSWLEARVCYLQAAKLGAVTGVQGGLYRTSVLPSFYKPVWMRAGSNKGTGQVVSWAISEDGQTIATANPRGRISLHDLSAGGARHDLGGSDFGYPTALEFGADGKTLLLLTRDHRYRRLSLATGDTLIERAYPDGWSDVAISGSAELLWATVSDGKGNRLAVVDAATGNSIREIRLPDKDFVSAGLENEGRAAYYQTVAGVDLIDSKDGHVIASHRWQNGRPSDWRVLPDSKRFIEISEKGVSLFDFGASMARKVIPLKDKAVTGSSVRRDGAEMVVSHGAGITFVDLAREEVRLEIPNPCDFADVLYSGSGLGLVMFSGSCGLRTMDPRSGQFVWAQGGARSQNGYSAFSPDEKSLFRIGWDGVLRRQDVATGRETTTVQVMSSSIATSSWLAIAPDGSSIAIGLDNGADRAEIVVLNAATLELEKRIALEGLNWTGEIVFTTDSRRIAAHGAWKIGEAAKNAYLGIWDIDTGRRVSKRDGWYISLDVAPDGTLVAYRVDGTIERLDPESLAVMSQIKISDATKSGAIRFGSTSKTAIAIGDDKSFRLFDVETGRPICVLTPDALGKGNVVSADLAVDPTSGRALLWSQSDNELRVVDLENACSVEQFPVGRSNVSIATLSTTGDLLFVQDSDGGSTLLRRAPAEGSRVVIDSEMIIGDFDVSIDGRNLFVFGFEELQSWNLASGRKLATSKTGRFNYAALYDEASASLQWVDEGEDALLCTSDLELTDRKCVPLRGPTGEKMEECGVKPHRSPWSVWIQDNWQKVMVLEKPLGRSVFESRFPLKHRPVLSGDERTLALPQVNRKVSLIDTSTWQVRKELSFSYDLFKIALDDDASLLALGSKGMGVELIDTRTGKRLCWLEGVGDWPLLAGDGRYLVVIDAVERQARVTVVDTTRACATVVDGLEAGRWWISSMTANGRTLVLENRGKIIFWPLEPADSLPPAPGRVDEEIEALGFRVGGFDLDTPSLVQLVPVRDLTAE